MSFLDSYLRKIWQISLSLIVFTLFSLTAFADYSENFSASTGKDGVITEFYRATGNVSVTSAGVGLSDPRSGDIVISSIPDDATVIQAWLYHTGYVNNIGEENLSTVYFDNDEISELKISEATDGDLTPTRVGKFDSRGRVDKRRILFRTDVKNYLLTDPNGVYSLRVDHTKKDTFGASLVIVYEDPHSINGTVVINDGMVMISNRFNGGEYDTVDSATSTITGLSLSNPPNGQLTIVVSEGTATDATELEVTGASTHTFGDFTSNEDGNVWDHFRVDAAPYLDGNTSSFYSTLRDLDNGGSYVHYYLNIFQTNLLEGDLSTSTLDQSKAQVNPKEQVSYTANLVNTGTVAANNSRFVLNIPDETEYVPGSIVVDGFSQTDALDLDDAHYVSKNRQIIVDVGAIPTGDTVPIIFALKMKNGLEHDDEIEVQGSISADGVNVLTDGDGVSNDGIDRPTEAFVHGGRIINLPSGFTVLLRDFPSFDAVNSRKTGDQVVEVFKNGEKVADVDLNLNDDVSLSVVSSETDDVNHKAYFHGFSQLASSTSSDSYTLTIPAAWGQDHVRICSGAESLEQIHEGCEEDYENVTDEFVVPRGATVNGVSCIRYGSEYWECSGLTGSGGEGLDLNENPVPEFSTYVFVATIMIMFAIFWRSFRVQGWAFMFVRKALSMKFLALMILFFSMTVSVHAESVEEFSNENTIRSAEILPSYKITGNVSSFVEGVGFVKGNNKKSKIIVNGVPEGAEIKQAFLYWLGFPKQISENQLGSVVFNGKMITPNGSNQSVLIAEEDPDGNAPKRRVYRADVSSFLEEEINGRYKVSPVHKKKDSFGAVLVLVYEHDDLPESTVLIEDGLVMLAKDQADSIVHGDSYSHVFNDLGGLDISEAEMKLMISNGPSKDKHDLVISGQTLKNVTRNNKGKALDILSVDLSTYFLSSQPSFSYDLVNKDSKGYYSHLFLNVLQSKVSDVDFSTSTLEVSKAEGKPGEIVDYSAELKNSSSTSASDLVFEVDLPEDAAFVAGSVTVNGFSQTDDNDLDDAYYVEDSAVLVVEPSSLDAGETMEVDFQVEILKGVDHEDAVEAQGQIMANGQQFLTDGDGDPIDGVDAETVVAVQGGLIRSLPAGFSVYLKEYPSIDPRVVQKTGVHTVVFAVDGVPVAEIDLDLDNDLVIEGINAAAVEYSDKAFFHGFQGMDGVADQSYTLLVPWNGSAQLRLCLGAVSIDQVGEGCLEAHEEVYDEVVFTNGQTHGDITCRVDNGFWRCDGVTGSGGQGEGQGGGAVPEFSTYVYLATAMFAFALIYREKEKLISLQHKSFALLRLALLRLL